MRYYLAPMEGLTTYNYRRTWNQYYGGMDKYFTPFIANKHLNNRERNDILPEHNQGMNTIPQILTNRADEFLELAEVIGEYGYREINLNLGCPSGTVVARKRGSGFLSEPEKLDAFLDEIYSNCSLDVSIKTRIGLKSIEEWPVLLEIYKKYPIKELIIHPRLQVQGYGGTPDLEAYHMAQESLTCPLCYNGDIVTVQDYDRVVSEFPGLEIIMIGRGILKDPELLQKIKAYEAQKTGNAAEQKQETQKSQDRDSLETLQQFHDTLLKGYREIMSGDANTLFKMKDMWAFLSAGFEAPEKYMKKIRKATNMSDYQVAVNNLVRECRPNMQRKSGF